MLETCHHYNFPDETFPGCKTLLSWLQAIVDGLGGVLFRFPFRVPAYYALILRSLTVLEGLALQADKNYKLLGKAYPYMAKRLLLDPAPELRWGECMPVQEMEDCLPSF